MAASSFDYADGTTTCRGRLALPAGEARVPGIAVFADIGGVGDHSIGKAEKLATLGFVALAADTFGEGYVPPDMAAGMPRYLALRNDPAALAARGRAALDALRAHPRCDGRLGAIGFCFGGSTILEVARHGCEGYLGGVSFHGGLSTVQPATTGFPTKLLVCHGAEDPLVADAELVAFLREMAGVGADCQTIAYTGAVHSFTNPSADGSMMPGIKYNEPADRRSWAAMRTFFDEVFG